LWSDKKSYGEHTDSFLKFNLARNYTVDGELGDINRLVNFKNELWGFQEKGIFNILYNQRAMVNTSIGQDVMLGSTGAVQGIRYITKYSGLSNKWAVIWNSNGLYYVDSLTRDIMVFGESPMSLTNQLGFKVWANHSLKSQDVYHIGSSDEFILNQHLAGNAIYANSSKESLLLNTRLNQFESFTPHKGIPFMIDTFGEFISIRNNDDHTELWLNNKGDYSDFYGTIEDSAVTYYMNPEPTLDKTFDNLQYRMDVFDGDTGLYLENDTFDTLKVKNEFQEREFKLDLSDRRNPNIRKKMRVWSMPIPRSVGTLQRIRNPWMEATLTFKGGGNKRFKLHDTVCIYTV